MRFKVLIVVFFLAVFGAFGQVVTLTPSFPKQTDEVTITFDASQGNAALVGERNVYAHMGLITSSSVSPSDWKYVIGDWGTADSRVEMTYVSDEIHTKTYNISAFHNLAPGETVLKLAFVFRTEDGSIVGRDVDGSDIFVDLFQGVYAAAVISPSQSPVVVENGDTLEIKTSASASSTIQLFVNNVLLDSASNVVDLNSKLPVDDFGPGKFWVNMIATDGVNSFTDSFYYILPPAVVVLDPPAGLEEGVNITGDSSVTFLLYAPFKDYAFVIGDFSNWELDDDFFMNQSEDGEMFWFSLDGLDPNKEYRFQYQIEEQLRIANIYSEKILDPWNDPFIDESTYPNLTPYPVGLTNDPVSVFQINKEEYIWDSSISYERPANNELVIYELLLRDFIEDHSYKGLKDSLDYLKNLGINALQIMPFNEFEGNNSWGYNPSFYFAPDKYYGPDYELKSLIEECHRRGIVVIMDMVLNHSFGQSPMVRMYFDPSAGSFGQPTAENPWFNPVPKHDFNVGFDFNHESQKTKEFTDKVMAYWVEEYRIDGYRMDLSKGFTQVNSLGNVGFWGQRDPSRIAIWNRIGNELWKIDSGVYIILEHFAERAEEEELTELGFIVHNNCNSNYRAAAAGSNRDLSCPVQRINGEQTLYPNVISYMESHDEERLFYDVNRSTVLASAGLGSFNDKIKRAELAVNMFLPLPGAKMIWQFGELGYGFSINTCEDTTVITGDCRTSPKPIKWEYFEDSTRKRLYDVYSALLDLRKNHNVFRNGAIDADLSSAVKRITLKHEEMDVMVLGNFALKDSSINLEFTKAGTWYEYYKQDSIIVDEVDQTLRLAPSEYRIYSSERIIGPFNDTPPILAPEPPDLGDLAIYPNPFSKELTIRIKSDIVQIPVITIYDMFGKHIRTINPTLEIGVNEIKWTGLNGNGKKLPMGQYIIKVETATETKELQVVFMD